MKQFDNLKINDMKIITHESDDGWYVWKIVDESGNLIKEYKEEKGFLICDPLAYIESNNKKTNRNQEH